MKVTVLYPQAGGDIRRTRFSNRVATPYQNASLGHSVGNSKSTDTVQLSKAATEVQRAGSNLEGDLEIREEKVAEIKERIRNGTYEIDSEKIAMKIIEDSICSNCE